MLAEQRPKLAMDAEILEGYSLDDIDKESLRGFRQLFMNLKPTHPWTENDDLTLLKHMKAYGNDRVSGKEGLTLAGLLMFGKYDAITDAMPQFMIDYREYTPGSERWSDRIYSDGTWDSNAENDGTSNGTNNGTNNGTSNETSIGLKELRELIFNKKKTYQVLSKVIAELCQDWTETKELADKTGLSVFHIKGKIIPRMIADGLLEPYDKESPKSPEQKYRAIKQN